MESVPTAGLGMRITQPGVTVDQPTDRYAMGRQPTQLSPMDEMAFRLWWAKNAQMHGQGGDPSPHHFYDYRGAWLAGQLPTQEERHWSSQFKNPMSPERYLLGKSGRVYDSMVDDPQEPYRYLVE